MSTQTVIDLDAQLAALNTEAAVVSAPVAPAPAPVAAAPVVTPAPAAPAVETAAAPEAASAVAAPAKRRGRPPGSKNKPKDGSAPAVKPAKAPKAPKAAKPAKAPVAAAPKRRGRPPGSKNNVTGKSVVKAAKAVKAVKADSTSVIAPKRRGRPAVYKATNVPVPTGVLKAIEVLARKNDVKPGRVLQHFLHAGLKKGSGIKWELDAMRLAK